MTGILLAFLINASVFSIGGIGEDLSVFRVPFLRRDDITRIGFAIEPEYTLLNQSGDYRGVFWTNPLKISLSVPVTHGFSLMVGNLERYNQCFDVYLEDSVLQVRALGEGAIEELYAGLNKRLGSFDLLFAGSFLFGNAWEIWTYNIGTYSMVDTFFYRHRGQIFSIGLKHNMFSLFCEGLGQVRMTHLNDGDTVLIDLPQRVSVGVYHRIGDWPVGIVYEHSFWQDSGYNSPNRFKLMASHNTLGLAYYFNPWYLDGVSEHTIDVDFAMPLRNVGVINVKMGVALRNKDGLREFKFMPKLTFVLNEIFARKRK